jgi:hypothetical protein
MAEALIFHQVFHNRSFAGAYGSRDPYANHVSRISQCRVLFFPEKNVSLF